MTMLRRCAWVLGAAALLGCGAHYAGASDLVTAVAAAIASIAVWSPGARGSPTARSSIRALGPGPTMDLGRVVFAPAQVAQVWAGQRFHVLLADLQRHVAVVGATGSGKTTTLGRFLDAALEADWPVLVVDAKGGRLADVSQRVAARHALPSRIWLAGDPRSWTYDICAGEPVMVANRLVGAFDHGREGQVFRNLSQAAVPIVLRAMQECSVPRDLDTLRFSLDRPHLVGLARRVTDLGLRSELLALRGDDLHRRALSGLVGRLRALRFGLFGPWLLPSERTLDLAQCLVEPGVTYLGLPATAASEDVALVGRVLVQHLKQVAYAALWAEERRPALVVFDEFVSLHEAAQFVDLLLQAREAHLAVVVSTQQVPREHPLRHSVLGAGTLIVHQIGTPEDADTLARALGTRTAPEIVRQIVHARDSTLVRRLLRARESFLIAPDELARLPVGRAVVSVRFGRQRIGLVQVDPLNPT
ncbi:MAG TPA: helicase HerA-like domain-containing protein [Chloroflexota bacterium]